MTQQLALFGPVTSKPRPPSRTTPPIRSGSRGRAAASPEVAADVLGEIQQGRFGMLDHSDRVAVFAEPGHVRLAMDEDLIHHLITAGLVQRAADRDIVSCLHGAIRRPVTPLRLTRRGRDQLNRWTALQPLRRKQ